MHCRNFTNALVENRCRIKEENSEFDFPKVLRPALERLLLNADNYLRFGEAKFFEFLSLTFSLLDVKEIFLNVKFPMACLVIILICSLLLLLAPPVVCLLSKNNRISDASKTRYCFGLETLGLIITIIWIMIGISIYLPTGNELHKSLRRYPQVARNLVMNINESVHDFRFQVRKFEADIYGLRKDIVGDVEGIPGDATRNLLDLIGANFPAITLNFKQIDKLFKSFDIGGSCQELNERISIYNNSISGIKTRCDFAKNFNRTFSLLTQKELSLAVDVALTNNKTNVPLTVNFTQILGFFRRPLMRINASLAAFQDTIEDSLYINISSWRLDVLWIIILVPVFYSGGFICLMAVCVCYGFRQINLQMRSKEYLGKLDTLITIINFTIGFLLVFLWLMFFLSGVVYLVFWPVAIACRALADGNVYTKYFDKTDFWNNKTWLESMLANNLQIGNSKLQTVIEACERNETMISALKLNQSLIEHLYETPISIDQRMVKDAFENSIELIYRPSIDFEKVAVEYQEISAYLQANLTEECAKSLKQGDLEKYNIILENIQKIMDVIRIYNKQLVDKLHVLEHTWSKEFFNNVTSVIKCSIGNMKEFARVMVNEKIGNCYVLPYTLGKIKSLSCDHLLFIIMALFVSISIMTFSTLISVFLLFHLTTYVRGFIQSYECSDFADRYANNLSQSIALGGWRNRRKK